MRNKKIIVFGGSGFIGRYVVQRLAKTGAVIGVPTRNIESAKFLRSYGDVGQITPIACNLMDDADLRRVIAGADIVINLLGILYESRKNQFDIIHRRIPDRIARIASAFGVKSFVHVSAIGADAKSDSVYARTKFAGEQAVRAALPHAVVLRPSIVFGAEDGFFNLFAGLARLFHILPLIGGGRTKFQPVYVGDVADAVLAAMHNPDAVGRIYELGGPKIYSFAELMRLMLEQCGQKACLVSVPFWAAKIKAAFLQMMPRPLLTIDQVRLLEQDNVVSVDALRLTDLNVDATALEVILPSYMDQYKPGGRLSGTKRAA